MGFFDRVKKIAVGPPETAVVADLSGAQVLVPTDDRGAEVRPEQDYYRIWVTEMSLKLGRAWFRDWHPAVQLATTASAADAPEYASFAGPIQIAGFTKAPGAAVKMEHPLTPLIPFRGGTVSATAGLIAIRGDSVVKSLIDTVGAFASLLGNAEVAATTKIASRVVDGIEAVLGLDADRLLIGLDRAYTSTGGVGAPNVFKSGYLAVLDAPAGSIYPIHLWVDNGRLLHRPGQAPATAPHVNYLLLWIERRDKRDDWLSMTSISSPYLAAVSAFDTTEMKTFYRQAIVAVRTHPMLTEADRVAFASQLRAQAERETGLGASGQVPGDLAAFAESVTMPADEALEAGTTLAELLDF